MKFRLSEIIFCQSGNYDREVGSITDSELYLMFTLSQTFMIFNINLNITLPVKNVTGSANLKPDVLFSESCASARCGDTIETSTKY